MYANPQVWRFSHVVDPHHNVFQTTRFTFEGIQRKSAAPAHGCGARGAEAKHTGEQYPTFELLEAFDVSLSPSRARDSKRQTLGRLWQKTKKIKAASSFPVAKCCCMWRCGNLAPPKARPCNHAGKVNMFMCLNEGGPRRTVGSGRTPRAPCGVCDMEKQKQLKKNHKTYFAPVEKGRVRECFRWNRSSRRWTYV